MINWRYHIMSIIAVFLALGVGITIGISLAEDGTITLGQESLVDDIRKDINEVRSKNTALNAERSTDLRYQDNTFPYLVAGRLQGEKIALVTSSSISDETRRSISSSIQTAGGQVVSTTVIDSSFDADEVITQSSQSLQQYPRLSVIDETNMESILGSQLALEVAAANPPVALTALQDTLVDSISGNYDLQADSVLLLTRADDNYSPYYTGLEREFILNLKANGFVVIGGETTDAPRSEVPMFIAMGIPSADNINSRIGQLSLIYALAGERDTYGIKPTSDMLIPILRIPVPEEEALS
jgi:hypothetical protein